VTFHEAPWSREWAPIHLKLPFAKGTRETRKNCEFRQGLGGSTLGCARLAGARRRTDPRSLDELKTGKAGLELFARLLTSFGGLGSRLGFGLFFGRRNCACCTVLSKRAGAKENQSTNEQSDEAEADRR